MYGRKIAVAALLFFAGVSVTIACGPFFPWQLFDDRTATLKATPKNSFAFEAAHLAAAPKDRLKAVEGSPYDSDADRAAAFAKIEAQGLSADQTGRLQTMRNAASGDEAFAAGDGLPQAIRLYAAGAVDFRKANLAQASQRFDAELALSPGERASRAVWAAFMLGKTEALAGDADKASAAFRMTRKLALEGQPDLLGLAVASFGEEAKLHYDRAVGAFVPTPPIVVEGSQPSAPPDGSAPPTPSPFSTDPNFAPFELPATNANSYRDEMAAAASLYAQQAARGSDNGVQSLRMIAEGAFSNPASIDAAVANPLLERLLVDYALARIDDTSTSDDGTRDAGTREHQITVNPRLAPLVEAIEKFAGPNPAGADRLAALSYRIGRYDLAAQLAGKSSSPLAEWVKAKIALQKGDLVGAAAHYAAASRGFPQSGPAGVLDSDNANLVVGEMGTVALARGEYVDALDKLYPVAGPYWGDVAYIAERVLTVDELKSFVDEKAPASSVKTPASSPQYGQPADPAAQLRNLLARRLMRDGRYDEAFDYFTDPKVKAQAESYAAALHDAKSDWWKVDRAQGYFVAASVARASGMDIMGSETAPDYYDVGGDYDCCVGQDDAKGAYVTAEERTRAAASKTQPDIRYHYRYIAVDEANKAADLLPPRSQAFAGVLCRATGWMMGTPDQGARVHALYMRYVKNGPYVLWAKKFGQKCPDPDFAGAISLERKQTYQAVRHYVSVHRWWLGAILLIVLAGGVFGWFRRREIAAWISQLRRGK